MGVADITFDKGMVESALSRSGGTSLDQYAFGPELPLGMRNTKASGKGVGHVYIHVRGAGSDLIGNQQDKANRSQFADANTAVLAIVEIMKHQDVKAALAILDVYPQTEASKQQWLHHIPVAGPFYGYERNSNDKKKIKDISINMRAHGDALFISSCYPEGFHA